MTIDDAKRSFQVREGYWFTPKPFGVGAIPVTWQGWALTLGFAVALLLDMHFVSAILPKIVIAFTLTAAMLVITWRKTDGDWHWRWGSRG